MSHPKLRPQTSAYTHSFIQGHRHLQPEKHLTLKIVSYEECPWLGFSLPPHTQSPTGPDSLWELNIYVMTKQIQEVHAQQWPLVRFYPEYNSRYSQIGHIWVKEICVNPTVAQLYERRVQRESNSCREWDFKQEVTFVLSPCVGIGHAVKREKVGERKSMF